jgi:hypothetical protein
MSTEKSQAQIEQEAASAGDPNSLIGKIVELAKRQRVLEQTLASIAQDVKTKTKELYAIQGNQGIEGELPKLMRQAGLAEVKLDDGSSVTVDEVIVPPSVAQTSEKRQLVLDWLRRDGHEGMIVSEVDILLDKGDPRRDELIATLKDKQFQVSEYETVNASSLKALIVELLKKGQEVPLDEIGVFIYRKAKVQPPKI